MFVLVTTERAIPTTIRRVKSNQNHTRPMDSIIIESELATNIDNDITLTASFGASDADLDYYGSLKTFSTRSDNSP